MGMLNNFFGKKDKKESISVTPTTESDLHIDFNEVIGKNGRKYLEGDYYHQQGKFGQFYDATRLIVDTTPIRLPNGRNIYSAQVSWYGTDDAVIVNNKYMKSRRDRMTNIKLEVDFEKLRVDGEYQEALMTRLLEEKRVKSYKERGLQDNPEVPCGDYIGYVEKNEQTGRYEKTFDLGVGEIVHNSPEQIAKRKEFKERQEQRRQDIIAEKQRKIAKLQEEIENLR